MSTQERRRRELAERELRFLSATRGLISEDGLLSLQMCRIAEKCDYAVGTLYQHFVSKEDLLVALAAECVQERERLFRRVYDWAGSTRERMLGFAAADAYYVRRNPDSFRLIQFAMTEVVWEAAPETRRQVFLDTCQPLGELTRGVVMDAIDNGDLEPGGLNPAEVCLGPWSMVSGMHMITHTAGLLEQQRVAGDPYRLLLRHCNALLNGMGWKPLLDVADSRALDALYERICREVLDEGPEA